MSTDNPLRIVTAELIAFGIVGSLLENAHATLVEVDPLMAIEIDIILGRAMDRFHVAETRLFELEELQ